LSIVTLFLHLATPSSSSRSSSLLLDSNFLSQPFSSSALLVSPYILLFNFFLIL
jgi:hypothetical protein